MKFLLGLGKVLTALFWGMVLANLLEPFAQPFAMLLNFAGAALVMIHVLELLVFNDRLSGHAQPGLARVQILLFGIFHLQALTPEQPVSEVAVPLEVEHA